MGSYMAPFAALSKAYYEFETKVKLQNFLHNSLGNQQETKKRKTFLLCGFSFIIETEKN